MSDTPALPRDDRPVWERIADLAASLPEKALESCPRDGATQLDHYLHGTPKRKEDIVSDKLRQAAEVVVKAWEREFGTTEDAVAFEKSIDALRSALAEGEGDHFADASKMAGDGWRYYKAQDGIRRRYNDDGEAEWFDDEAEWWRRSYCPEIETLRRNGFRTDADGNRLEGK